ncbi:hypothetical protein ACFWVF_08120 [Streptomyces sp. NPDC058659]|uniref:hypothetical protein n=1 Tax=unclassified Streptomyces TaxID=2593676 RepID=UPI003665DA6D
MEKVAEARELAGTAVRDSESYAVWCAPYALVALARGRVREDEPGGSGPLDPAERTAVAQGDHQAEYEVRSARAAALTALGREWEAAECFDRAASLAEKLPYPAGAHRVAGARRSGENDGPGQDEGRGESDGRGWGPSVRSSGRCR